MRHGGGGIGQYFLGLVDLRALRCFQPGNLIQRQVGEQAHEAPDIGVLRVAPELPVIIGRERVGIEPHRALCGLAHLAAVRRGDERGGKAENLGAIDPAGEFDAIDDIAPLVGPAHLQATGGAARQFQKIVGLQDHIIEFEEAERLFAVEPQLDRIEAEHPVDREMLADVTQERDIFELVEPVGIVDHHRVGRAIAEGQEAFEHALDARDILRDLFVGQQRAGFVAQRRIADLAGAATHQDDRLVPGLLHPPQHHDLHQAADVQRRRGGIETDIARHHLARGHGVEAGRVG